MTIESQNQLLNPKDRLALRNERTQDLLNKQPLPDPFSAYVFIDHSTEELVTAARSNKESAQEDSAMSGPIKCRVYNEDYHSSMINPIDAKTRKDYEEAINSCSEALLRSDHPDLPKLANGSIWQCTRQGQTVQLLTLESDVAFSFTPRGNNNSNQSGAQASFNSSRKTTVGSAPRNTNNRVEIKFKENRSSLINQSKKFPYKDFLPVLEDAISKSNFSQAAIVITSMFRGPVAQVNAMMGGRIFQGDSASYQSFKKWAKQYGTRPGYGKDIQDVIAEKDWSTDVAGLKSKLTATVTEQYNAGRYISKHMEYGALDIRTNDLKWSDVETILSVLSGLQSAGHVKRYQIENKRSTPNSTPPSAEHIHFSLTTKGAAE